jgi:hypothetical protein
LNQWRNQHRFWVSFPSWGVVEPGLLGGGHRCPLHSEERGAGAGEEAFRNDIGYVWVCYTVLEPQFVEYLVRSSELF